MEEEFYKQLIQDLAVMMRERDMWTRVAYVFILAFVVTFMGLLWLLFTGRRA